MKKNKLAKKRNLISVIIPAYKQEKTIVKDIIRIEKVLVQLKQRFGIIVVVDGIVDKTYERAKKYRSKNIRVYSYSRNHGKGFAIRYGMLRSKGDIIGFIDSGMDLNPNGISLILEQFGWLDADIIIGSKRHPASRVEYPLLRKIISLLSQILIKVLFGLNVRDTQVGMKFFRREVLEDVLPRLVVRGFAFDIEILAIAHHLGYKRIFEAPVELDFNPKDSIVSQNLLKALFATFLDTLEIFYRLRILNYYDNKNKKKWRYDKDLDFEVTI